MTEEKDPRKFQNQSVAVMMSATQERLKANFKS